MLSFPFKRRERGVFLGIYFINTFRDISRRMRLWWLVLPSQLCNCAVNFLTLLPFLFTKTHPGCKSVLHLGFCQNATTNPQPLALGKKPMMAT